MFSPSVKYFCCSEGKELHQGIKLQFHSQVFNLSSSPCVASEIVRCSTEINRFRKDLNPNTLLSNLQKWSTKIKFLTICMKEIPGWFWSELPPDGCHFSREHTDQQRLENCSPRVKEVTMSPVNEAEVKPSPNKQRLIAFVGTGQPCKRN